MYRSFHHNQYFARCTPLTAHFTSACDDGRRSIFTLTAHTNMLLAWAGTYWPAQHRWCLKGFVPRPGSHRTPALLQSMAASDAKANAAVRCPLSRNFDFLETEHLHSNLLAISWRIFCVTALYTSRMPAAAGVRVRPLQLFAAHTDIWRPKPETSIRPVCFATITMAAIRISQSRRFHNLPDFVDLSHKIGSKLLLSWIL